MGYVRRSGCLALADGGSIPPASTIQFQEYPGGRPGTLTFLKTHAQTR